MFIRKNSTTLWIVVVLLVVILAACSPQAPSPGPEETEAVLEETEIGGYTDLVEALEGSGASVEPGEQIQQEFFEVPAQIIQVNGVDVQVFEFPDEAARQAAQETISPDGSSIGTTMVTWVDEPHFFAEGRLIVLYLGSDVAIVDLLQGTLGDPIAG